MLRTSFTAVGIAAMWCLSTAAGVCAADAVRGKYVEARTCQIYTGPCFANGEVGSVGKNAILVWRTDVGSIDGVDLAGRSVALVVKTSDTLGFNGFDDAEVTRAMVIVDRSSTPEQTVALEKFVLSQTGISRRDVVGVRRDEIQVDFDTDQLTATVSVGRMAHLVTRKARPGDCICSNESAYYPPLTKLLGFVPGVTIEGDVTARPLGTRWSIPDSRSAYLGMFDVDASKMQLAASF